MTWLDELTAASSGSPMALRNDGSRLLVGLDAEAIGATPLAVLNVGAGRLYCSLDPAIPPDLVFEVPRTWPELEPVLRHYIGAGGRSLEHDRTVRLSVGFPANVTALATEAGASPFRVGAVESGGDTGVRGKPSAQFMVTTRWSRSHVVFSVYGGLVLVTLRYAAAGQASTVQHWNERTSSRFSDDTPIDVLALLHQHRALDGAALHTDLDDSRPPGVLIASLLSLELLSAPISESRLQTLIEHADPEVRRAAISVAGERSLISMLRARVDGESEPKLRSLIERYLGQL